MSNREMLIRNTCFCVFCIVHWIIDLVIRWNWIFQRHFIHKQIEWTCVFTLIENAETQSLILEVKGHEFRMLEDMIEDIFVPVFFRFFFFNMRSYKWKTLVFYFVFNPLATNVSSYRNQAITLPWKSGYWFLFDGNNR